MSYNWGLVKACSVDSSTSTNRNYCADLTLVQEMTKGGGVASARAYIPELLADVLAGKIDPSPVLDFTVDLEDVPAGYAAMDGREAIKVMVRM